MHQCLFCDETKLTKEHVFPDWIVDRYRRRLRGRTGQFNASFSRWDGRVKRWTQPTITQRATLLCKDCNNVKIGSIENVVKPFLIPLIEHPSPELLIGRHGQLHLATWILVRAMVWDGIAPPERRYYTQSRRTAFADSDPLTFPDNTHIWIAHHLGSPFRVGVSVGNHLVNEDDGMNITTAVIGHMAIQLISWKGEGWTLKRGGLRREGWDTATKQIWPLRRKAIQWPPPAYLDREGLKAFSQRFGSKAQVFAG